MLNSMLLWSGFLDSALIGTKQVKGEHNMHFSLFLPAILLRTGFRMNKTGQKAVHWEIIDRIPVLKPKLELVANRLYTKYPIVTRDQRLYA